MAYPRTRTAGQHRNGVQRGLLGSLLGIEPPAQPAPLAPAEVDLADGDIVELDDGVPQRVAVLARLEGGTRVCVVDDGADEALVVLDGTGRYWLCSPLPEASGDLVAEAYRDGRVVGVRVEGRKVVVDDRGAFFGADLDDPGRLGATWCGTMTPGGDVGDDCL